MATTAKPKRRGRGRGWLVFAIIGGVIAIIAAFFVLNRPAATPVGAIPPGWQTVSATTGTIDSTVSATGNIDALAQAKLRFEGTGTIVEVLVKPGDAVQLGQPLARLDAEELQLNVAQAEADLASAQAELDGVLAGSSEQEIAEAQARVDQARRQYEQTATSVSQADIAAARADLESARAKLAELQAGPASDELAKNEQTLVTAQRNLEQARTDLATAKEQARLNVEAKANALRNAQDEYSRIYWQNRELDELPGELPQSNVDQEAAALRAVQDGEAALEQARLDYDKAVQNEINTLQTREADVKSAQAAIDRLVSDTKADEIAAARAEVSRAQASLAELTGTNRTSDLAASESNIAIAQAGLDKLLADPESSTLAQREAAIAKAEISLKQAQRKLNQATLAAPFAGIIASVDMRIGEPADTSSTITLVDLSSFLIDLPVDELDVAQVAEGQPARIAIDALTDREYEGTVTTISPIADRSEQGTTTYKVRVVLGEDTTGVRAGMTAVVEVITSIKENAVLVPRRAIVLEGGKSYVRIPKLDAATQQAAAPAAPGTVVEPPNERREVVIGLSNSEFVEIVSGLSAGEEVLIQDVVSTFNPSGPPQ
jgi:RND family efflux transporter MFP subunit